jgi:ABC-type phosphate transport system substrate-binding protein
MRKSIKTTLVGASVAALALGMAGTAHADVQPGDKDTVAVGSDTVQYVVDFLADGTINGNDPGYNTTHLQRRIFSFDATSDAAGRAQYGRTTGTSTAIAMQATVVLRAGTSPALRPNGSGNGIAKMIADSGHLIDWVRSSRLPKPAEQGVAVATAAGPTTAGTPAGDHLHSYQIALDGLQMATASTTNAPAGLSCATVAKIYDGTFQNWNQVPGFTTAGVISPGLPQAGSGTGDDFRTLINACTTGGTNTFANPNIVVVEEHDPSPLVGNPNAIAPFSSGRYNLFQSGYFGAAYTIGTIKLQGTPVLGTTPTSVLGDTTPLYLARKLYIVVRDGDVAPVSPVPFQVGDSRNFAQTLFANGTSYFASSITSNNFAAAGVQQAWADAG